MGLPDVNDELRKARDWWRLVRVAVRGLGFVVAGFAFALGLGLVGLNRPFLGLPPDETIWDSKALWLAIGTAGFVLSLWSYAAKGFIAKHAVAIIRRQQLKEADEDDRVTGLKVENCKWRMAAMIDCVLKNYGAQPITISGLSIDLYRAGAQVCAGIPLHPAGERFPVTVAPGEQIELQAPCQPIDGTDKAYIAGQTTLHQQRWKRWGAEWLIGAAPATTASGIQP